MGTFGLKNHCFLSHAPDSRYNESDKNRVFEDLEMQTQTFPKFPALFFFIRDPKHKILTLRTKQLKSHRFSFLH